MDISITSDQKILNISNEKEFYTQCLNTQEGVNISSEDINIDIRINGCFIEV